MPPSPPSPPPAPGRQHLAVKHLLALALLALLVLAPGIAMLPVTDRDEALYVQSSRQMLETGNWLDIRFQDAPRYKKPIGIYWLQGAAALATGYGADAPLWVYRLPSLLGATLVVLLTGAIAAQIAGPIAGPTAGFVAGLICLATVSLGLEARLAKTDAVLAATILAAQYALVRLWLDPDRARRLGRNLLFWSALGLGILIKGPIAPLIVGLTLATLCLVERRLTLWRGLAPVAGLALMLAIALPWLVAIAWISNGAFFTASLGQDLLGKVASGQQGHGLPPGAYLLMATAFFWPMVALLPAAAVAAWRRRGEPRTQVLLAWIVPNWLLFELIATKLPNYLLPLMPAVAILAALPLAEANARPSTRLARWPLLWIPLGAAVLALGLNLAFRHYEGVIEPLGLTLSLLAVALAVLAWDRLSRDDHRRGLAALIAAAGLLQAVAYAVLFPAAKSLWLSDRIAAAVAEARRCEQPERLVADYREPSLVVRLGTATRLVDASAVAARFAAAPCAVAVVASQHLPDVLASLDRLGAPPPTVTTVSGRNLGDGRRRDMAVLAK